MILLSNSVSFAQNQASVESKFYQPLNDNWMSSESESERYIPSLVGVKTTELGQSLHFGENKNVILRLSSDRRNGVFVFMNGKLAHDFSNGAVVDIELHKINSDSIWVSIISKTPILPSEIDARLMSDAFVDMTGVSLLPNFLLTSRWKNSMGNTSSLWIKLGVVFFIIVLCTYTGISLNIFEVLQSMASLTYNTNRTESRADIFVVLLMFLIAGILLGLVYWESDAHTGVSQFYFSSGVVGGGQVLALFMAVACFKALMIAFTDKISTYSHLDARHFGAVYHGLSLAIPLVLLVYPLAFFGSDYLKGIMFGYVVVLVFFLQLLMVGREFNKHYGLKKVFIISYFCATEVVPVVILLKVFT